jgi:2-keto-4-pentenoate hydratase/2-oxohepta-3-ene-1,7-dioic acid hydratase in catechol pathway
LYRIEHGGAALYAAEREGRWRLVQGDVFGSHTEGPEIAPEGVRVLAPVMPSKIVCVGLNYKDHAAEQKKALPEEPLLFLKPSTSVIGPGEPILIPGWAGRVDHEAELGLVIGRRAFNVKMNRAYDYVLGLISVNDVTARELQAKDGQYTRSKGFDTFAPIGPCIAVGLDGRDLQVRGYVNGDLRQDSRTRELIFTIPELVEFISSVMTLLPGDIISTGTPAGIGPIKPGDSVTVHVEGVGALTNPVAARPMEPPAASLVNS